MGAGLPSSKKKGTGAEKEKKTQILRAGNSWLDYVFFVQRKKKKKQE